MPLTTRKIAHISSRIALMFAGRSQTINLTCKNADGTTRLVQLSGILKPQYDFDPSFDTAPGGAQEFKSADALLQLKISDIDFPTVSSVIYAELAAPVGADLFASRYIPTSIKSQGIAPGGDRWFLTLERQRP